MGAGPDGVGQERPRPWPRMDAVLGVLFGQKLQPEGGSTGDGGLPHTVKVEKWQHRISLDRQTECNANGQQPEDALGQKTSIESESRMDFGRDSVGPGPIRVPLLPRQCNHVIGSIIAGYVSGSNCN